MEKQSNKSWWLGIRRKIKRFTWGGAWASALPPARRNNLTLFFYNGLFSAASDRIIITYMTIYLLSLNVTRQQIGLLNSLSNFSAALLLLPAALLSEYTGQRKNITLASNIASRLAVLLMAVLPFFFSDLSRIIWIILLLGLLREVFSNFGYPGWIALTGDIVPLEGRGRYFGTRNFIMGITAIFAILIVGETITQIGEPIGYQLAFILAVAFGGVALWYFAKIMDRQTKKKKRQSKDNALSRIGNLNIINIFTSLRNYPVFINFLVFNTLWSLSLNIAGPFFDVYMVDTLNFTAAMIGVSTVAHTIASFFIQPQMGALADRWGNRNISIIFMVLIPIIPLLWGLWINQYWQVILVETIAGFFWGAFNLASFNNLLRQTPQNQRARFSAFHQIVVTLSLSAGAAIGSLLIALVEFRGLTIISAIGRWIAAIFFIYYVKEVDYTNYFKTQN